MAILGSMFFSVWYSRHFGRFQDLAAFAVDDSDEEEWELVTWATQRGRCGQVGRGRDFSGEVELVESYLYGSIPIVIHFKWDEHP